MLEIPLTAMRFSNWAPNKFCSGYHLTAFIKFRREGEFLGLMTKKLSYITAIDLRKIFPLK